MEIPKSYEVTCKTVRAIPGTYHLIDETFNNAPVWQQDQKTKRIYLGDNGAWLVGTREVQEKNRGWVMTTHHSKGRMPHMMSAWVRSLEAKWVPCDDLQLRPLGAARSPLSLPQKKPSESRPLSPDEDMYQRDERENLARENARLAQQVKEQMRQAERLRDQLRDATSNLTRQMEVNAGLLAQRESLREDKAQLEKANTELTKQLQEATAQARRLDERGVVLQNNLLGALDQAYELQRRHIERVSDAITQVCRRRCDSEQMRVLLGGLLKNIEDETVRCSQEADPRGLDALIREARDTLSQHCIERSRKGLPVVPSPPSHWRGGGHTESSEPMRMAELQLFMGEQQTELVRKDQNIYQLHLQLAEALAERDAAVHTLQAQLMAAHEAVAKNTEKTDLMVRCAMQTASPKHRRGRSPQGATPSQPPPLTLERNFQLY